jgi:hypothetical protein
MLANSNQSTCVNSSSPVEGKPRGNCVAS